MVSHFEHVRPEILLTKRVKQFYFVAAFRITGEQQTCIAVPDVGEHRRIVSISTPHEQMGFDAVGDAHFTVSVSKYIFDDSVSSRAYRFLIPTAPTASRTPLVDVASIDCYGRRDVRGGAVEDGFNSACVVEGACINLVGSDYELDDLGLVPMCGWHAVLREQV